MTIQEAIALTKTFTVKPSTDELLRLYGLYKQATEGDNTTERPGGFDFKAAAKYNAWESEKGKTKEAATEEYVKLVESLSTKYV